MATHNDDERRIGERLGRGREEVGRPEAERLWADIEAGLPLVSTAPPAAGTGVALGWAVAATVGMLGLMIAIVLQPGVRPEPTSPVAESAPTTSPFAAEQLGGEAYPPPPPVVHAISPADQWISTAKLRTSVIDSATESSLPTPPLRRRSSSVSVAELPAPVIAPLAASVRLPALSPAHSAPDSFSAAPRRRWTAGARLGTALSPAAAAPARRSVPGLAGEVSLRYYLRKRLFLSAALSYTELREQLDHTARYDSLVAHPGFPDTDRTTPASVVRRVQHGNRTALLSVPLLVGYQYPAGRRWTVQLMAGPEVTTVLRTSGKQLTPEGRVVPAEFTGPTGQLRLGYRIELGIGYRSGRWRYRLTGTVLRTGLRPFEGAGAQMGSGVMTAGVGLHYTL